MRVLILAVVLLLALPAAARAQDVDAAAQALSSSDYVYVDPSAEAADEIDERTLEHDNRAGGEAIFVAVLPASAAEGALREHPGDIQGALEDFVARLDDSGGSDFGGGGGDFGGGGGGDFGGGSF